MSIQELIRLLENRLSYIAQLRQGAVLRGDLGAITELDQDSTSTQATLDALRTLA
jgi:hypothetical protein